MKLSAPVHVLKSQAKVLKKSQSIRMTEALDLVAKREGFGSWSLLQAKCGDFLPNRYAEIPGFFNPGDLVLIGGRPGVGKTSFTIGLLVQAIRQAKAKHFFFTLDLTRKDVVGRLVCCDPSIGEKSSKFCLDYSDDIDAKYVVEKTKAEVSPGSWVVIDYLQLLDQKRSNPPLQEQVEALKEYAREKKCILVFISQVHRAIEARADQRPGVEDIRLPNPLDAGLFNKILFLYRSAARPREVEVLFRRPREHVLKVGWADLHLTLSRAELG